MKDSTASSGSHAVRCGSCVANEAPDPAYTVVTIITSTKSRTTRNGPAISLRCDRRPCSPPAFEHAPLWKDTKHGSETKHTRVRACEDRGATNFESKTFLFDHKTISQIFALFEPTQQLRAKVRV